jgi:hypothetical protein
MQRDVFSARRKPKADFDPELLRCCDWSGCIATLCAAIHPDTRAELLLSSGMAS